MYLRHVGLELPSLFGRSWFGFNHCFMIILAFVDVIIGILLLGCNSASNFSLGFYILEISYRSTAQNQDSNAWALQNLTDVLSNMTAVSNFRVRAGYFDRCAKFSGVWVCGGGATDLAASIQHSDPLGIVGMADRYRAQVLSSALLTTALILATIAIAILARFPGWKDECDPATGRDIEVKLFPGAGESLSALSSVLLAAILGLVSAVWQQVSAAGAATVLESSVLGLIHVKLGPLATACVWLQFILILWVTIGLLIVNLSLMTLRHDNDFSDCDGEEMSAFEGHREEPEEKLRVNCGEVVVCQRKGSQQRFS